MAADASHAQQLQPGKSTVKPTTNTTTSTQGKGTATKPTIANSKKHPVKAPAKASPAEQVEKLVHETLSRNTFYKPGYLISRKDLEPVFSKLLEKGITNIDSQEGVIDLVLAESSQLVKLLKTPDGRDFMAKLGNDPAVYDRLERMSWTFDGRRLIEKLVDSKDGPALLKSLKTPEQFAKFSKEVAADPRTKDFALPTGKAHTAEQFIQQLKELLQQEASAE